AKRRLPRNEHTPLAAATDLLDEDKFADAVAGRGKAIGPAGVQGGHAAEQDLDLLLAAGKAAYQVVEHDRLAVLVPQTERLVQKVHDGRGDVLEVRMLLDKVLDTWTAAIQPGGIHLVGQARDEGLDHV